jgi:hypothetical protein
MYQPSASRFTSTASLTVDRRPVGEREVHVQIAEYEVVGEASGLDDRYAAVMPERLGVVVLGDARRPTL